MCADDGEPSLIFSSSVGWRREDGGGMRGASGAETVARALLDGFMTLLGLTVVNVLQKSVCCETVRSSSRHFGYMYIH